MKTDEQHRDDLSVTFLGLWGQYYAIARYCASFSYGPIYVTMFHHAIEMLMKGYLIKTHSTSKLKKRELGHDLSALWVEYKSTTGNESLSRFDKSIDDLDQVERLRYPDKMDEDGFILNVSIEEPVPLQFSDVDSLDNKHQYFVHVSNLDKIVLSIFDACNVEAKSAFKNTPAEFMKTLPPEFK